MSRIGCEISLSCHSGAKYWLLFSNLFFFLAGLALLMFGLYDQYESIPSDNDSSLCESNWYSKPSIMIIVGASIFLISFFGCCGAINESSGMMLIYALLLVFIILVEMIVGIVGMNKREEVENSLAQRFNESLQNYEKYKTEWKNIQSKFECCGVTGPDDWQSVFRNLELPAECCEKQRANCKRWNKDVFESGCLEKIFAYIDSRTFIIGCVGIGLAVFQIISLGFSLILYKAFQ